MRAASGVVIRNALLEIRGMTDVAIGLVADAFNNVGVKHQTWIGSGWPAIRSSEPEWNHGPPSSRVRDYGGHHPPLGTPGAFRAEDGGAEGIRTPDPHNAIVVLYQLSYDPIRSGQHFRGKRRIVKANCPETRPGPGTS